MRKLLLVVVVSAGFVAGGDVEPAAAGTYWVNACADGDARNNSLTPVSVGNATVVPGGFGACAPGQGLRTIAGNRTPDYAAVEFCAPAGTTIKTWNAWHRSFWSGGGFGVAVEGACGSSGVLRREDLYSLNTYTEWRNWDSPGNALAGVRLTTSCAWFPCGGPNVETHWRNAWFEINDPVLPVVSGVTGVGASSSSSWLRGPSQPVGFTVTDNAGVRRSEAQIAGRPDLTISDDATSSCDHTRRVPCPATRPPFAGTLDTTKLPDGTHSLSMTGEDTARNRSEATTRTFRVDNTPPVVTLLREPNDYSRTVTWKVGDAGSGIDPSKFSAQYMRQLPTGMEAGKWDAATGTYSAKAPAGEQGAIATLLRHGDNAQPGGNGSTATGSVTVDTSPPAAPQDLTLDPAGWSAENAFDITWTNPAGQVSPIVRAHWEACSQVDTTDCVRGSSSAAAGEIRGVALPHSGAWDLTVWLEDAAGNNTRANSATAVLRLDSDVPAAPTISAPAGWLSNSTVTNAAADFAPGDPEPLSGVVGYSVSTDGQEPDETVDVANTLPLKDLPDGVRRIRARTISGAGRAGPSASAVVRIDRVAPIVTLLGAGDPLTPHPGPITVTISARDATSGMGAAEEPDPVERGGYVAYKLNGDAEVRARGDEAQVAITGEGWHTLEYRAVDRAGNSGSVQERRIAILSGGEQRKDRVRFWDVSLNPTTQFSAAAHFGAACPKAPAALTPDRDAAVDEQGAPTEALAVAATPGARRQSLLGFPLPAAPDCGVHRARLRLLVTGGGPAELDVRRAGSAWDEDVTWELRPGATGVAASATARAGEWVEVDVTEQVRAQYRVGDNGLVVSARSGAAAFASRLAAYTAQRPQLILEFDR